MRNTRLIILCWLLVFLVLILPHSCNSNTEDAGNKSTPSDKALTIFVAASMTDVMAEIIDSFEVEHNIVVKTNIASSGILARQIEQGAKPDVYISASKDWADYLDSLGLIIPGYKKQIARNRLVFIAPVNHNSLITKMDSTVNIESLLGSERLSMGDPSHVPAGKYAKQALQYFGLYDSIKNKTLPAKDVRSALLMIEMNESPLGIVYRTDAQRSNKVKILYEIPENIHDPIVYIAGLMNNSATAKTFYTFINSDQSQHIWKKYGFLNPNE